MFSAAPATDTNGEPLRHGATDNGNGTATNPAIPTPPAIPRTLSATAFQEVCDTGVGGAARFGDILRAMDASDAGIIFSINNRLKKSDKFDKDKAALAFTVLVANSIMTNTERTNILAAWPVQ